MSNNINEFYLPVYVINLKDRTERKQHIMEQFQGKPEFKLMWIDWFWCTQFIVVFKSLFRKILDYNFKDNDTADGVLSVLVKDKMTVYPFISIQKNFGYSDVTRSNNDISGLIDNLFQQSDHRLKMIHYVTHKFRNKQISNDGQQIQ